MNKEIIDLYNERKVFEEFIQPYKAAIKIVKTKLEIIDEELKYNHEHSPIHNIYSRIKSPENISDKLKRKNLSMDFNGIKQLNNIAGIRVICNYLNDIQYVAQLLVLQDDVIKIKQTNYIQYPKSNGYRSLHLIIKVPVYYKNNLQYVPVEIQIRTIAMDWWASLEHELTYKKNNEVSDNIKHRLKECADLMAKTDCQMQEIYMKLNQPWKNN